MRRRVVSIFAALSLFICIATTTLWIRSYWIADWLTLARDQNTLRCFSSLGKIWLIREHHSVRLYGPDTPFLFRRVDPWDGFHNGPYIGFGHFRFFGHTHMYTDRRTGVPVSIIYSGLLVPHYLLVGVTAVLPAFWVRRLWLRNRSVDNNLCPTCTYNLTGNTSGICPECGTSITHGISKEADRFSMTSDEEPATKDDAGKPVRNAERKTLNPDL